MCSAVVVPDGEDPYLDLIGEYLCRTARSATIESLTSSGMCSDIDLP